MTNGFFHRLCARIFNAEWKGRRGEQLIVWALNRLRFFGRKGKVLHNVYVPKGNGEMSEIDVVFISQKGIFVIESKNYSGWIFGDERAAHWTARLSNQQSNQFYNPIKQNQSHLYWLGRYLANRVPLFSLIVFSKRCKLKQITLRTPDVYVIKRNRLNQTIRAIWERAQDRLSKEQVHAVYEALKPLAHVDRAVKEAHVARIRQMQQEHSTAEPTQAAATAHLLICPRCGGDLVLRQAKQGPNAGKPFYGCAQYPRCTYIKEIAGSKTPAHL